MRVVEEEEEKKSINVSKEFNFAEVNMKHNLQLVHMFKENEN